MITTTNTILLDGLVDPANDAVWREFDDRYRPVIEAFAVKLGLRPEDAADAAQETMVQFARDYRAGRYDRERGRLRSWIFGIARHRVLDAQRARARRRERRGESALSDVQGSDDFERIWDDQWRKALLRTALDELRAGPRLEPRTLRAFELVALRGVAAAEAAREIGMSIDEIYVAKSRVLKRLRQIVSELEQNW